MQKTKTKQKRAKPQKRLKNQKLLLDFEFRDLFTKDYRWALFALIVLPLLVYLQVWHFKFVWDDSGHLSNSFVINPSWANLKNLFNLPYFGMYIPINYLFLGVLKAFAELLSLPLNSVLHLTNVVVHIINGLLVFTILKQFVINKWAVLIGTGFFLLHPLQVETVVWVSELRSLLGFGFSMAALYWHIKNPEKLSYTSLLFFVLAVLSKPSAVTLVLFVFLINYFHYKFNLLKNIWKTLPYALIALIAVVIAHSVQAQYDANISQYTIAFWQRPFAWLDSMVFYFYKILYPYHLSASYTLSPKFIATQWWFYPLALLPLALGWLLWLKRKKQPLLIFAILLFITGFFTTSGFVDFAYQRYSLVANRYLYFSMFGVGLFVATVFAKVDKKYWQGLIIGVLVVFATLSVFKQIPTWKNEITLWTNAAAYEVVPNYVYINLGLALSRQGKYSQAITSFDRVIDYYQKHAVSKNTTHYVSKAFFNKGNALSQQKKYPQAMISFDKAIANYPKGAIPQSALPHISKAFFNKGGILFGQKKYPQAIVNFDKAIACYPNGVIPKNAIQHISEAFSSKGAALFNQKKHDQAWIAFNQAVKINPKNKMAHNLKAITLDLLKNKADKTKP